MDHCVPGDLEGCVQSSSLMNRGEAIAVAAHVRRLLESGVPANQIAVQSPYSAQVELMRTVIADVPGKWPCRRGPIPYSLVCVPVCCYLSDPVSCASAWISSQPVSQPRDDSLTDSLKMRVPSITPPTCLILVRICVSP